MSKKTAFFVGFLRHVNHAVIPVAGCLCVVAIGGGVAIFPAGKNSTVTEIPDGMEFESLIYVGEASEHLRDAIGREIFASAVELDKDNLLRLIKKEEKTNDPRIEIIRYYGKNGGFARREEWLYKAEAVGVDGSRRMLHENTWHGNPEKRFAEEYAQSFAAFTGWPIVHIDHEVNSPKKEEETAGSVPESIMRAAIEMPDKPSAAMRTLYEKCVFAHVRSLSRPAIPALPCSLEHLGANPVVFGDSEASRVVERGIFAAAELS